MCLVRPKQKKSITNFANCSPLLRFCALRNPTQSGWPTCLEPKQKNWRKLKDIVDASSVYFYLYIYISKHNKNLSIIINPTIQTARGGGQGQILTSK